MQACIPKIYKTTKRFSGTDRPRKASTVIFNPCNHLTTTELVPNRKFPELLDRPYVYPNAPVKVVENRDNTCEVLFQDAPSTDLVAFEDLMSKELTEFGKALFKLESKLPAQTKNLLGESNK